MRRGEGEQQFETGLVLSTCITNEIIVERDEFITRSVPEMSIHLVNAEKLQKGAEKDQSEIGTKFFVAERIMEIGLN